MFMVYVGPAFAITPTLPGNTFKYVGQSVSFTSGATGGNSVPLYQWIKDGGNLSGQTTKTSSIGSVALSDAGTHTFQATSAADGTLTSNGVLHVASSALANDTRAPT